MKKNMLRWLGIFFVSVVLATSAFVWAFSPKKDLKPSEYNIGETYESAMKAKKPFVAMFFDDMCSYCVWFTPKFKILSEAYGDKYNFVMVNLDLPESEDTAREYAIGSLPTLYIIDPVIDNRVLISNTLYGDLRSVRVELERYLRIRSMIKL